MSRKPITAKRRERFLQCLRETGIVTLSSKAAKTGKNTLYALRKADENFRAAWDDALDDAIDRLEQEAWRRAHDGVDEPVFHKGKVCGQIRRYSDTLLIFLLKANRPEKYREKFDIGANLPKGSSIKFEMILGVEETDGSHPIQSGADVKQIPS